MDKYGDDAGDKDLPKRTDTVELQHLLEETSKAADVKKDKPASRSGSDEEESRSRGLVSNPSSIPSGSEAEAHLEKATIPKKNRYL